MSDEDCSRNASCANLIKNAICDILWLHLSSFVSIFLDWQKLRCLLTFELMDLILAYEFSGYFVIFIVH